MGVRVDLATFAPDFIINISAMNLTIVHIILLLMPSSVIMAQHQMVVVNVESKVPIRDVRVCTDNGQVKAADNGLAVLVQEIPALGLVHAAVLALASIGNLGLPT